MKLIAPDCWSYGATIDPFINPQHYSIDWSKIKIPEPLKEPEPHAPLDASIDLSRPKSKSVDLALDIKPQVKPHHDQTVVHKGTHDIDATSGSNSASSYSASDDDINNAVTNVYGDHDTYGGNSDDGAPEFRNKTFEAMNHSDKLVRELLEVVDSLNRQRGLSNPNQALSDCDTLISDSNVRYFDENHAKELSKSEPNSPTSVNSGLERAKGEQFSFIYDIDLEKKLNSRINIWVLKKIQWIISRPSMKDVPILDTWARYIDGLYSMYMSAQLVVLLYAEFSNIREENVDIFDEDNLGTCDFHDIYFYTLLTTIGINPGLLWSAEDLKSPNCFDIYNANDEIFHPDPKSISQRQLPDMPEHPYVSKEAYVNLKYHEFDHGDSVHLVWTEWYKGFYGQPEIRKLEYTRSILESRGRLEAKDGEADNLSCPIRKNILMFIYYGHFYRNISPQISVDLLQSYMFFNDKQLDWLSEKMDMIFDKVYDIDLKCVQSMLVYQSDVPFQ